MWQTTLTYNINAWKRTWVKRGRLSLMFPLAIHASNWSNVDDGSKSLKYRYNTETPNTHIIAYIRCTAILSGYVKCYYLWCLWPVHRPLSDRLEWRSLYQAVQISVSLVACRLTTQLKLGTELKKQLNHHLCRGYMWNKIILKSFQRFVSRVTTAAGLVGHYVEYKTGR